MIEVVDFRSDTLTVPDEEMRRVMSVAEVGDDVFGEDPSVIALQRKAAELLGKEAALFVPSGTMANLIGVLNHCSGRGSEIILGDDSHIFQYEQGGIAQLGGVHPHTLPNLPDGTFSLQSLRDAVRSDDLHFPVTRLVCVENTHNMKGGKVLPLEWLDQLGSLCRNLKLPIHMDGARLLNAAVALQVPPSRLTKECESVSLCFSKGLGAPVGSVIAGRQNFIQRALRLRKALGGGMRQCGILAAAGSLALARYQATLSKDHEHARTIARAVKDSGSDSVTVDVEGIHTNIIMLDCSLDKMAPKDLETKLRQTIGSDDGVSVKALAINNTQVRLVTHCNLTTEAVAKACQKIIRVIRN